MTYQTIKERIRSTLRQALGVNDLQEQILALQDQIRSANNSVDDHEERIKDLEEKEILDSDDVNSAIENALDEFDVLEALTQGARRR